MEKLLGSRYRNNNKAIEIMTDSQIRARDGVNHELEIGNYVYETYNCECGNSFEKLIKIAEKDRYGLHVETRICPSCGLLMTNPRMTQDSYNHFYDKYYRDLYTDESNKDYEVFFNEQKAHGKRIVDYLKSNDLFSGGEVLEIGAGMGGILSGIREVEPHATVKGIDLGSEYIEQGKIRGIQLEVGNSASEAMINPKKYDLIILSHVLEHFLDLDSELNNISLLLKEDGIVYIEVPGLLKIHETPNFQ